MKIQSHDLASTLDAVTRTAGDDSIRFAFGSNNGRYELYFAQETGKGILRFDRFDVSQPCPDWEFSFSCDKVVIGPSAYDNSVFGNAVRFYRGGVGPEFEVLCLTPKGDDNWYVWCSNVVQS